VQKNFQRLHAIVCDSHYHASKDQSCVHTHVTIQNRDVVAVIGASVKCAATHGPIGRLFEMQILRLSSYIPSCFVINVHAYTYALAEPAKHAANLSVNGDNCERMRVPIEPAPSNINSLFL